MIVDPRTTDGAAYITECLKASRTPQLFFKMVHRDSNGNITSSPVYDTSQIKSYKISDSICNNSDYSVGNVPNMEFDCEVFNSTDDTENVVEMEVFFNPFDDDPATVRQDIENTTVGNAPSNPHTARIATFYCTGAYFYEGLMVFRGVDAVGLHTNAYWPDNDNLTYPVTGRQLLNSALLWGGFKTIPSSQSFVNLDDIAFSEPPVGYTIRQVLEILCAMEGANLVHVNDFRSSGGAEYDFKVAPMYPGRYTYASLAGRSLPEMWAYDTTPASYVTIHDSNIFNIKRLQKPIVFAGVQYAGTYYDGSTAPNGSTYYLEIPQNEMLNNLSNATIATYMNRLADIYKGWNYFPINMTCVSVPFVQDFDRMFLPEQNLSEAVVTSTNLTGLGSETIVTAGNTVPMNDYRYSGKGVSRYDKNAAMLNRLYKYIYPGKNNIAIGGTPRQYTTMPPYLFTNYFDLLQIGKAQFDGDIYLADASGNDYRLTQAIVQRANTSSPITTAGWYRLFQGNFVTDANSLGRYPQFVEVTIRAGSSGTNTCIHSIKLLVEHGHLEFLDELSQSENNVITKIRYNTDGNGKGFIDAYLNPAGGGQYFSADILARPYMYTWDPKEFTSVATAPTGETVQTEYTFLTWGHHNPLPEHIDGWITANGNLTVNGSTYFHGNAYLRDVATHNYNIKQVTQQGIRDLKYITTTGWYRIAECQFDSANNASGRLGQFVEVNVRSSLTALHSIKLSLVWNALKWVDELSSSNANPIKQIRYTTNASNKGFIDVYYDNGGSSLYLSADIIAKPFIDACQWTPVDWTSVGASPSGETIRTSYTFNGNAVNFGSGIDAYFGGEVYYKNVPMKELAPIGTQRITLSTSGWYRVFQQSLSPTAYRGISIDINIATRGDHSASKKITLMGAYNKFAFANETSIATSSPITKIRYTTNSGNTLGFIDIYYTASGNADGVEADFLLHPVFMGAQSLLDVIDFQPVASAPSGETVRAEYTFKSNYNEYDDRYYSKGTAYSVTAISSGWITNSSKEILVGVQLPKMVPSNSVSVSALEGVIRHINGGYADGWSSSTHSWVGASGITVTPSVASGNQIFLDIVKTSEFLRTTSGSSITNNTPITMYVNKITFTFS